MDTPSLQLIRNIGIISHIDAGKTTVSERILFYTGETHKMGEVHEGQAVMDWMPQEQERGITITATATTCRWGDAWINLIDTPGHIDFTIEVERSMRVLDGAVAVFSAVEGVQPQSESVWRQAERYQVPRICFINKMDRVGADYRRTLLEIMHKLGARPVLLQLPIGNEGNFAGVCDLIGEQALYFAEHDQGRTVERRPLPPETRAACLEARQLLVEAAADFDDAILADYLEGQPIATERLKAALARGTAARRLFPVLLGAALRNKGIQPLLDAVVDFLPSPVAARPPIGISATGEREAIACDPTAPFSALAFKVISHEGKKLTFMRIYGGTIAAGAQVFNSSRRCPERLHQLFRMHAHKRERLDRAGAGDIVAVLGLREALTGDTLCDPHHPVVLESLAVPEPVVSLAVEARRADDREKLLPALEKLQWEDPTFRVREDPETGQTLLNGMGELHLEIIIDRLERDFGVQVKTGPPKVVYRETVRKPVERRELFQKEMDGKIQQGEILLRIAPGPRGSGIAVVLPDAEADPLPPAFRTMVEESLRQASRAGCRTGYPLTDLTIEVVDVPFQPGVTTELGLRVAAHRVLTGAAASALELLEPVMALEIVAPGEHAGKVLGGLQQKRSRVEGIEARDGDQVITVKVPLAEMFGYMTDLRSATKGRGAFTMEFSHFDTAPAEVRHRLGLE